MAVTVHHGDSRDVLKGLPDASVHAVVTDPPYALVSIQKRFGKAGSAPAKSEGASGVYKRASAGFMGQSWDVGDTAFDPVFWGEVWRVLKPGGHVVAFSATRTYHRLACAIEDAGFEIRDMVAWLYGSGFPKSHDVSKGIDKRKDWASLARLQVAVRNAREALGISQSEAARRMGLIGPDESLGGGGFMWFETGQRLPTRAQWPALKAALSLGDDLDLAFEEAEREVVAAASNGIAGGTGRHAGAEGSYGFRRQYEITSSATSAARQWEGWGTALKPALEPIVFARKPLEGTVAANVLKHGTGALNIDGCRVSTDGETFHAPQGDPTKRAGVVGSDLGISRASADKFQAAQRASIERTATLGRWPANVVHDGSDEVVEAFPGAPGQQRAVTGAERSHRSLGVCGDLGSTREGMEPRADQGSAARFFYCAEPDNLCALCGCPSRALSAKLSPCDARTAEPSSPTRNTPAAGSALCAVAASPPRGRAAKSLPSSDPATTAESCSAPRPPMGNDTAGEPAPTQPPSSLVLSVRSAGNLCASCATAIAQSLAATRRGQDPASLPCPASIGERSWRILTSNLALYVAGREHTDTITTTESLKTLLGSVLHAIAATTSSERAGSAASIEPDRRRFHYSSKADAEDRLGSKHPTVKPVDLMRWLCRLVTPPGGTILDPFAGTGSTGLAAMAEGFDCILIEREEQYVADIHRRIAWAKGDGRLTAQEKARQAPKPIDDLPLFGGEAA